MAPLSNYDFLNQKYNFEDFVESFSTAMGILFCIYMLLMARSEPALLLIIMFAIIFSFLLIIQKKYKEKYEGRLKTVREQINVIKTKLKEDDNNTEEYTTMLDKLTQENEITANEEDIITDEENLTSNNTNLENFHINPYNPE